MKQSVIIDIGSSKVLAMVVCPAADGAIIVQNAEERTYSGYRFGELPNAAALSDTLESIASALRSSQGIRLRSACVGVPAPFTKTLLNSCRLLNPDRTASRNRTSIFCLSRRRISLRRKALR
mgnify:CR=1 FL=1